MGETTKARVAHDGESFDGEALFETDEILVRGLPGKRRLVIALSSIAKASVRDGTLSLIFDGKKRVSLELGARAGRWLAKIENPKSVVQKLGVKAGQRVLLVGGAEASFAAELEAAGARVSSTGGGAVDHVFLDVVTRRELGKIAKLAARLADKGGLWIVRTKGSPDVTAGGVMEAGRGAGLVDVKVVRLSAAKTALKFVVPVAKRA